MLTIKETDEEVVANFTFIVVNDETIAALEAAGLGDRTDLMLSYTANQPLQFTDMIAENRLDEYVRTVGQYAVDQLGRYVMADQAGRTLATLSVEADEAEADEVDVEIADET